MNLGHKQGVNQVRYTSQQDNNLITNQCQLEHTEGQTVTLTDHVVNQLHGLLSSEAAVLVGPYNYLLFVRCIWHSERKRRTSYKQSVTAKTEHIASQEKQHGFSSRLLQWHGWTMIGLFFKYPTLVTVTVPVKCVHEYKIRTGRSRGGVVGLYSGEGARSNLRHRLYRLSTFKVFFSSSRQMPGHDLADITTISFQILSNSPPISCPTLYCPDTEKSLQQQVWKDAGII
jgi:hypothetical protein